MERVNVARLSVIKRGFSSAMPRAQKLRIGIVPEHFSAPVHLAYKKFGLSEHALLQSFPSGTGTMIEALKDERIDVGIGLTEAWVAGLAKCEAFSSAGDQSQKPFHITSEYVRSPLRWALSTGGGRNDMRNVSGLRGNKVGVSRMGSGSHIMSTVFADQHGWMSGGSPPFEVVVCGPFSELRKAVNSGEADFFMWEHFTTKHYWDRGELKRIGEIETPWNGWHIAVRGAKPDTRVLECLLPALQKGVNDLRAQKEEALELICNTMEYSKEDARDWYKEVRFPESFGNVNEGGISAAISSLAKVGIIKEVDVSWQAVLATDESRRP